MLVGNLENLVRLLGDDKQTAARLQSNKQQSSSSMYFIFTLEFIFDSHIYLGTKLFDLTLFYWKWKLQTVGERFLCSIFNRVTF